MTDTAVFWWAGLRGPEGSELPAAVHERVSWYEKQVRRQRIGFYASEILIVLLSAAIPASAAVGASTAVLGVLGALVVVAAGMRQLFRWGENWIRASGSLSTLHGEVVRWSHSAAPYQDPADAGAVLAARIEAIVLAETSDWATTRRAALAAAEAAPPPPASGTTTAATTAPVPPRPTEPPQ